jgi:nicotinamidase/pyrazinamidase
MGEAEAVARVRGGFQLDAGDEIGREDCLLVVDVQNDFCPGGALAVPHGDEVIPVVNDLMSQFRHIGLTQDWHTRGHISFASSHPPHQPLDTISLSYGTQILWPDHCIPGSRGAEFHAGLDTVRAEFILRKGFHPGIDSYSAFYENDRRTATGLSGYLRSRGLRRLFLGGLATDYCVLYSALDARREGFEVYVIEEAVRGLDVDGSMEKARTSMLESGIHMIRLAQIHA